MVNATSYSISEAAAALKLSPKTIRRYIKSGKLASTKVPTKFGDEYRITEIPEALKQEAEAQAQAEAKSEIVPVEEPLTKLDALQLYQENIRLAAQLGAATERIRQMEEQLKRQESPSGPNIDGISQIDKLMKLLEAPKAPPKVVWWKRLFGMR